MAFQSGLPEANRLTAQFYMIDASFSVVVAYDYEIGSGSTTEIATLGILEIL